MSASMRPLASAPTALVCVPSVVYLCRSISSSRRMGLTSSCRTTAMFSSLPLLSMISPTFQMRSTVVAVHCRGVSSMTFALGNRLLIRAQFATTASPTVNSDEGGSDVRLSPLTSTSAGTMSRAWGRRFVNHASLVPAAIMMMSGWGCLPAS